MRVIPLIGSNIPNSKLESEHGLSLYIETDNHKILFDTGASDLFLINATKLNIDLKEVDTVVISHGHYDHLGGLIYFLEFNQKAKVYLKKEIFDFQYFSIREGKEKLIGYSADLLQYKDRFVYIECAFEQLDDLYFISTIDKNYQSPKGNSTQYKNKNSHFISDDYNHELIFIINSLKGLYVFCGCAHNGILNTLSTVKRFLPKKEIYKVIGGFHLVDAKEFEETETENEIKYIASQLKGIANRASFYTGHCTGKNAFGVLSNCLENDLHQLSIGKEIEFQYK